MARQVTARRASLVVANSVGGKDYWSRLPAHIRRTVVNNALPLDEIDAAVAVALEDAPGPGVPIVLHVGRLSPEKNVPTLVRAFARIGGRAKLIIVGKGPQRGEVHRLIADLRLAERVLLIDHVDRVWALMKGASIVVSLSHHEGQPNVLLEAMACKCPIIASDIPSHFEILDDSSAMMVDREDVNKISAAIEEVIAHPGLAQRRAANARARIEHQTFERCAAEYEALYESIRRRPSRPLSPSAIDEREHLASPPLLRAAPLQNGSSR